MVQPPNIASPFMQTQPLRFRLGTVITMLLTVVGAGVGLLIYYALQIPAITSEVNAWLGRPNPVVDTTAGRAAQVSFLLVVYSAPLVVGLLVYLLHNLLTLLDAWTRTGRDASDEPFRMECGPIARQFPLLLQCPAKHCLLENDGNSFTSSITLLS